MKRLSLLLALILSLSLLLTACSDDDFDDVSDEETGSSGTKAQTASSQSSSAADGDEDSWTVMLYLCGTDLESENGAGTLNLEEILDADESDAVNFIIETGGSSYWEMDGIDTDVLSRYRKNGDELELIETQPLARMSDVDTYTDFLTWAVQEYPADKYMLILWDHGMGSVDGVIYDELYDEDDPSLTVKDVAAGIAATNETFELVGFDACLMSTLEQASALCPYARYMVASEETEPGSGWDYTAWYDYLTENVDCSGADLGKEIVDSFYSKCESDGEEADCTLAVTDLSKIPALVEAYNAMATEMKGYTDDVQSIKTITGAFKAAEGYGGNNDEEGYTDMVDLGDLTLNAKGVLNDTGDAVLESLMDAVVYHKNGVARAKGEGLSVYVPLSLDEERYQRYAEDAAVSAEYLRFLESLYDFDTPDDVNIVVPVAAASTTEEIKTETVAADSAEAVEPVSGRSQKIQWKMSVNDDGYIQADITSGSDIIDAARCNLYWYNEDEDLYYFLGSDYNVYVNDDWNEFEDNFDDTWVYINDNLCMLNAKNVDDECITYSVPVLVNDVSTNLQVIYRYDTEEFEIIGLWDGISSNGIPSRATRQLKDGDQVDFRFIAKSGEDDKGSEVVFEGFTVDGDIDISEEDLGDGIYTYSMTFEDIFGGSTETEWAYIFVEDGEIECEV